MDQSFAITQRDLEECGRRYGSKLFGVIGIQIGRRNGAILRKMNFDANVNHTLIHIGTFDLRKAHGMDQF